MDSLTLAAWGRTWIEGLRSLEQRGILRVGTLEAYERVLRLHLGALAAMRLDQITRPALMTWARSHVGAGCSRKSLVLRVAVVKVCLRDAMGDGLIATNPAERLVASLRLPRERPKQRWFEGPEQAAAFLAAAEGRPQWTAIAVLTYTGVRLGEALGLQWCDLDLEGHRAVIRRQVTPRGDVTEPKSAAGARLVDLPGVLVDVLRQERARQREASLRAGWAGREGRWVLGMSPSHNSAARARIRKAIREALGRAGLPHLTPHGLRHSWVSFRALLGQDERLIQEQAGHSDAAMTRHYTHLQRLDPRAADEVAEAIRPRQAGLFRRPENKS